MRTTTEETIDGRKSEYRKFSYRLKVYLEATIPLPGPGPLIGIDLSTMHKNGVDRIEESRKKMMITDHNSSSTDTRGSAP